MIEQEVAADVIQDGGRCAAAWHPHRMARISSKSTKNESWRETETCPVFQEHALTDTKAARLKGYNGKESFQRINTRGVEERSSGEYSGAVMQGLRKRQIPEKNPLTSGIVRLDFLIRKSDGGPAVKRTRFALVRGEYTLASHQGEPGSIPGRVTGPSQMGIMPDDAVGRGSSRGSPVSPLPFITVPLIVTSITLMGSQYLAVKSRPDLCTHFKTSLQSKQLFTDVNFTAVSAVTYKCKATEWTDLLTNSQCDKRTENLPRLDQGANSRPLDYKSASLLLIYGCREPVTLTRHTLDYLHLTSRSIKAGPTAARYKCLSTHFPSVLTVISRSLWTTSVLHQIAHPGALYIAVFRAPGEGHLISRFPCSCLPVLLHPRLTSPPSALKLNSVNYLEARLAAANTSECGDSCVVSKDGRLLSCINAAVKRRVRVDGNATCLLLSASVSLYTVKISRLFTDIFYENAQVIKVSMEQHRNEEMGETGDPRENPLTSGIVWRDSHMRKSNIVTLKNTKSQHIEVRFTITPFWSNLQCAAGSHDFSHSKTTAARKMEFSQHLGWKKSNFCYLTVNDCGKILFTFTGRMTDKWALPPEKNFPLTLFDPMRHCQAYGKALDQLQYSSAPILYSLKAVGACTAYALCYTVHIYNLNQQRSQKIMRCYKLKDAQHDDALVATIPRSVIDSPRAQLPCQYFDFVIHLNEKLKPNKSIDCRYTFQIVINTRDRSYAGSKRAVRLLASHHGEPASIPDRVTSGFSQVGIVLDDAADQRISSVISHFLCSGIPTAAQILKSTRQRDLDWRRASAGGGDDLWLLTISGQNIYREDSFIIQQAARTPQASLSTIQEHVTAAWDTPVPTSTIPRRLAERDMSSRRPLLRLPLRPEHRRACVTFCRGRAACQFADWRPVVFKDEVLFCSAWIQMTVGFGGVMVWRDISYDPRAQLVAIRGTMTARRHIHEFLRQWRLVHKCKIINAYPIRPHNPHPSRTFGTRLDSNLSLRQLWQDLPQDNIRHVCMPTCLTVSQPVSERRVVQNNSPEAVVLTRGYGERHSKLLGSYILVGVTTEKDLRLQLTIARYSRRMLQSSLLPDW
ncbi:hypothetical protein PR048_028486 [Dryococelus australis]|uniref:Transposase Tc1-like domain-containing protein n=1 Tax=Dryococelus australis TaxID=614101 RepID=A0ABQ9GAQ0_9NEOP|nr:hypothetical protein PR048_028486 [Dryococelus australis]